MPNNTLSERWATRGPSARTDEAQQACCCRCYLNRPTSKKKPVARIAVAAMASPGHKCHSLMACIHDFFAMLGPLSVTSARYRTRSARPISRARLNTAMRTRV